MEKVENGILEIENILNSELSGFNHNFEVMEYYIESDDKRPFKNLLINYLSYTLSLKIASG